MIKLLKYGEYASSKLPILNGAPFIIPDVGVQIIYRQKNKTTFVEYASGNTDG